MKRITHKIVLIVLSITIFTACAEEEELIKGDTSLVPWSNGAGGLFSKQNSKLEVGFEYISLHYVQNCLDLLKWSSL